MTTVEVLESYRNLVDNVNFAEDRITDIRLGKSYPWLNICDGMPHASSQADLSDYICSLDKAVMKLIKAKNQAQNRKADIMRMTANMKPTERQVIILYYINFRSLHDISKIIGKSTRQTQRIYKKAIHNVLPLKREKD